jgi:hypothetical protein
MEMNPGKAGPKGALAQEEIEQSRPPGSKPVRKRGDNTQRNFVQLPKQRSDKQQDKR